MYNVCVRRNINPIKPHKWSVHFDQAKQARTINGNLGYDLKFNKFTKHLTFTPKERLQDMEGRM